MPSVTTFADVHAALRAYWPSKRNQYRQSLDFMHELLAYLGNPQDRLRIIHVAGTSGKTSTAYYTAALLQAAGNKVGLTVSPHVDEVNERLQIDLVPLAETAFCASFNEFLARIEAGGFKPSYFELFIALAYWEFARRNVDYAVVEVGIGGLLDSTNVISRPDKVCIITDIGFDHMRILGNTLAEIAAQKAGIIQLHNAVFCYRQGQSVMAAIRASAHQKQGDLHILSKADERSDFAFMPPFQQRNFGLGLAAAQFVLERDGSPFLSKQAIADAAHTPIAARMEIHTLGDGKLLVVDSAHNAQKFQALLAALRARFGDRPIAALVRMPGRIDRHTRMSQSMKVLMSGVQHVVVTSLSEDGQAADRTFDPEVARAVCRQAGTVPFEIIPDPLAAFSALRARPEPVLLVCGSFFLLNHIRPLL